MKVEAVTNLNAESCYRFDPLPDRPFTDSLRFQFAFQKGKWVFKTVTRVNYNTPEIAISAALGRPVDVGVLPIERSALKVNGHWLASVGAEGNN